MTDTHTAHGAADHAKNSPGNNCDACRTETCPSRIHVRDMISERGSVTLCRRCRTQLAEVGA